MSGYTNPPPMDASSPTLDHDPEHDARASSTNWNIGPAAANADCLGLFNTCCGAIFICLGEYCAIFTGCFQCCGDCCAECLKCGCNT